MNTTQLVWSSLLSFIDTYDVIIYSTNGVSSLIFLAGIALLMKKFGVVEGNIQEKFSRTEMVSTVFLILAVLTSIGPFVSNFFIQNYLSEFFEVVMKQESTSTGSCCNWHEQGDLSKQILLNDLVEYFRSIHNDRLMCPIILSITMCALSAIFAFIWFLIQITRSIRDHVNIRGTS